MDTNQARLNIWLLEKRSSTSFMRFLRAFCFAISKMDVIRRLKLKAIFWITISKNIALICLGLLNVISEAPATRKSAGAIENAVYLELISRGLNPIRKVVQKENGRGEIDFAVERNSRRLFIQTVFARTDVNKFREIGNLLALDENGRKIVVFVYGGLLRRVPYPVEAMSIESFALAENLV